MADLGPIQNIIKRKPYLAWDIKDSGSMSEESVLEHILNFGDWDDFIGVEKTLGINKTKTLFGKLTRRKRVNLRPQTISYFKNYFAKYAP